jgi:hypothetical protein
MNRLTLSLGHKAIVEWDRDEKIVKVTTSDGITSAEMWSVFKGKEKQAQIYASLYFIITLEQNLGKYLKNIEIAKAEFFKERGDQIDQEDIAELLKIAAP